MTGIPLGPPLWGDHRTTWIPCAGHGAGLSWTGRGQRRPQLTSVRSRRSKA